MQEKYSTDPRLDRIARHLDTTTRALCLVSLAALALHIPAKLLGFY